MGLRRTLESSIERAEEEIKHCKEELEGKREITKLHRNSFHYIAGTNGNSSFYFDEEDVEYQRLREVAIEIVKERARDYDSICRKYLDVEDMIRIFQQDADDWNSIALSNLRDIQNGELIGGAHVLNYVTSLVQEGSSDGFEAYSKISDESHGSDFRRDSVQREIKVFEDYIILCHKKLDTLTPLTS